jgi:hypothetical protein
MFRRAQIGFLLATKPEALRCATRALGDDLRHNFGRLRSGETAIRGECKGKAGDEVASLCGYQLFVVGHGGSKLEQIVMDEEVLKAPKSTVFAVPVDVRTIPK